MALHLHPCITIDSQSNPVHPPVILEYRREGGEVNGRHGSGEFARGSPMRRVERVGHVEDGSDEPIRAAWIAPLLAMALSDSKELPARSE